MTDNTSVTKEFGSNFEGKILQAILGDPRFGEQIIEVLSPDLFDSEYLQDLVSLTKEHYQRYNAFPTPDLLDTICRQKIGDKIKEELCHKYISAIKVKPLNGDSEYVKENSLKYFKTQYLKNTLLNDVIPRIQTANFEEIVPIMEKAMQKGTDRNVGYEYMEDEEERFKDITEKTVPSPWPYVNDLLNGGWGAGRLVTIIGSQGTGKTHYLVNVGCGALMGGKTVVHYTLELSDLDVARRYDANLTDVEINSVPKNKDKVLFTLKNKIPEGARLIIKEYPMKGASVQTIKSHLSRLRLKGIIPDIIVIDYGDLLRAMENNDNSYHALEAIWREMKALSQELKIPVVTATQTNRTGAESDVVLPNQISDSFAKTMVSDIIITIARNMEQKVAGIGKMYLAKNRQGEDGQIFCYSIDTKKSKINCFAFTAEDGDDLGDQLAQAIHGKPESTVTKLQKFLQERKAAKNE